MDKDTLFNLYEAYKEYNQYTVLNHTLEISDEGWIRLWSEKTKMLKRLSGIIQPMQLAA